MPGDTEQNWALVIEALYSHERSRFKQAAGANTYIPEDSALIGDTGVNRTQLEDAAQYLLDAGLIEDDGEYFRLTPRGFEVAHQREMLESQEAREDKRTQRQNTVNKVVGLLTLGLMYVGTVDMFVRGLVGIERSAWTIYPVMTVGAIGVMAIAIWIYRSGILDPENEAGEPSNG